MIKMQHNFKNTINYSGNTLKKIHQQNKFIYIFNKLAYPLEVLKFNIS